MPKKGMISRFLLGPEDYSTSSFLNECFRGFGHYAYHSEALQKLSPEAKNRFLTTYQDSLGLAPGQVNTTAHATKYIADREATLASLTGVPFTKTPEMSQLENSLRSLDTAIENIGARFHPDNLTKYLSDEQAKTIGIIEAQHVQDKQAVETAYASDPIKLKNALTTLKAAQDNQLKTVKEGFKNDINALHKAVEREQGRVAAFAALRRNNEEMRKLFDRAYLEDNNTHTSISMGGESGVFKGLDFDKLTNFVGNNFKTLTGRKLRATKGQDGHYVFDLDLPNTSGFWATLGDIGGAATDYFSGNLRSGASIFTGRSYYSDISNRAMLDMLVTANLLKVSGEENPYAKITGFTKNPEMAMKLAQDAYAALLMVGYAEDKIKIIVNGKTYSAKNNNLEELFKNNPSRKAEIDKLVSMHQPPQTPAEKIDDMKREIEKERAKYQTPAASSPAATSGPVSSPPSSTSSSGPASGPPSSASSSGPASGPPSSTSSSGPASK